MLTVYMLKNGVGRYNTSFFFLHEILIFVSFLCRIRQYFCLCHACAFPSANNFAHAQTPYRICLLCRSRNIWILYGSTLNSLMPMDTRKSKSVRACVRAWVSEWVSEWVRVSEWVSELVSEWKVIVRTVHM